MTRAEVDRYLSLCPVGSYIFFHTFPNEENKYATAGSGHGFGYGLIERK
jgi:tetrahydromethanopterin S-methyltransferase subunit B